MVNDYKQDNAYELTKLNISIKPVGRADESVVTCVPTSALRFETKGHQIKFDLSKF